VGGALSHEDGRWHPARPGFYLPVRALSRIVRAKLRDRIATDGLLGEIPGEVWSTEWNVNCQPAGNGLAALQYLAPYVFKVAISERCILGVDDDHVRFRYQKPHSNRVRIMTLPIMDHRRPVPQPARAGTASGCPSPRAMAIVTLTLAPPSSDPARE